VDDNVDEALADKLKVPLEFDYEYFEDIQHLKIALGASPGQDFEDSLVIRDEYKKLRQALENDSVNYRAIVVTGHPGIGSYKSWFSSLESNADFFSYLGKTTFLFYLLLYRLENKLPTAVQFGPNRYILFDEDGAIEYSLPEPYRNPRLRKCWALTDSNNLIYQPCPEFQLIAKVVILISSPRPERWKEWRKQAGAYLRISDLPSVPEIAAIV